MNRIFFIIVPLVIGFAACSSPKVYDNFKHIDQQTWDKDSIVNFKVAIIDTNVTYNILINTRNLENYPFSNLWLFVTVIAPDHTEICDTLEYQMAKPNGQWLGKGTSGVYLNQFLFKSNVYFPLSGNYEVKIQQGMRNIELKGLSDIGLTIEEN